MGLSDWADWWDKQKKESEEILEEWVVENPHWWAIGGATAVQTSLELGQGLVDVLRIGEGIAEGTAGGVGRDALRLLAIAGPLARGGATLSRYLTPLLRAGNLRVAVQVGGLSVQGPCTFQAVNNALAITRRSSLFVTIDDMAKALGVSLNTVAKAADGTYKIAAWIDDLIPAIRQIGARVRTVTGLRTINEVVQVARRETAPVIFAIRTVVKGAGGTAEEILHSVIAFRTPGGAVRFADYGGRFVNTLDDLVRNLGSGPPIQNITLIQQNASAVVINGTRFTGAWASQIAKGAILVLEGLHVIETPNGVEVAIPIAKVAAVSSRRGENVTTDLYSVPSAPPTAVMKGSFEAYKQRRKGAGNLELPTEAKVAGRAVAPKVEFLTGVQFRLNALGFASGPIDGIMGPLTRKATKNFQRFNPPLTVDGIPGPKTQAELSSICGY